MTGNDLEHRLSLLEEKVRKLEQLIDPKPAPPPINRHTIPQTTPVPRVETTSPFEPDFPGRRLQTHHSPSTISLTTLMGVGGIAALLLAAVYLVGMALDSGWLTPIRQVGIAVIASVLLIGAGFILPGGERYRSLLPAGGLVTFYVAIYGGAAFHNVIPWPMAYGAVALATGIGLWLGQEFRTDLYLFLAIVGCYLSPVLLRADNTNLSTLALFFMAWSLLFCAYAILAKARAVYVVAGYFALLGFDYVWRNLSMEPPWQQVLMFQGFIFLLLLITAAWISLRFNQAMTYLQGMAHLPLLAIFYVLQYSVWQEHTNFAPWVSLLSALVLATVFFTVKGRLGQSLEGGAVITAFYCVLVLVHAGFFELMPAKLTHWSSLLYMAGLGIALVKGRFNLKVLWPIAAAFSIIFAYGCLTLILREGTQSVPAQDVLHFIYAILPYGIYFASQRLNWGNGSLLFAYIGHINMMGFLVHVSANRLVVSLLWAALAMMTMALAHGRKDKPLSQSALIIFAACSAKLLIYDLASSGPLIRIGCLVALGISLYAGGLIYQRIDRSANGGSVKNRI